MVDGFTENKDTYNEKNALSDNDSIHRHRNLNDTERSVIAHHQNFNTPKICKFTVHAAVSQFDKKKACWIKT